MLRLGLNSSRWKITRKTFTTSSRPQITRSNSSSHNKTREEVKEAMEAMAVMVVKVVTVAKEAMAAKEAMVGKEAMAAMVAMVATVVVETIVGDAVVIPVDLSGNWRQMPTPSSRSP